MSSETASPALRISINGGLMCWSSRLQAAEALSTAEAETIAATEAVKQVMHLRLFLRELGQEQVDPTGKGYRVPVLGLMHLIGQVLQVSLFRMVHFDVEAMHCNN